MAFLTGYLPVEQGVAGHAALRKHADAAVASGDGRTRDQIMADTFVERLNVTATAEPPVTATAAEFASVATTHGRCPAGRSASSTPNDRTRPTPS
jgi:hypothetical protein